MQATIRNTLKKKPKIKEWAGMTATAAVALGLSVKGYPNPPINDQSRSENHQIIGFGSPSGLQSPQIVSEIHETHMLGRPDNLKKVEFVSPASVNLSFADGVQGVWTFRELGLDMENMKKSTVRSSSSGTSLEVKSKWDEVIEIDASSLRAVVDSNYAAELESAIIKVRGPLDKFLTNANSLPHN